MLGWEILCYIGECWGVLCLNCVVLCYVVPVLCCAVLCWIGLGWVKPVGLGYVVLWCAVLGWVGLAGLGLAGGSGLGGAGIGALPVVGPRAGLGLGPWLGHLKCGRAWG